MKDIILDNGTVKAHVNAFGAELKSLEMDGLEYLWQGDPKYYARTSPTLFPIMALSHDPQRFRHGSQFCSGMYHGYIRRLRAD